MKLHKTLLILFLLLFASSANAEKIDSHWNIENITVDGNINEWTEHGLTHFEDEKFSIGFRNDSLNLYLLLATRDTRLMNMIYRGGINFWVNLDSKEKKEFGIKYFSTTEPPKLSDVEKRMEGYENKYEEQIQKHEQMRGKIILTENDNQRLLENKSSNYIQASSSLYKGAYLVEVKIPFDSGELLTKLDKNKKRKDLKVGVELGSDKKQMNRERRDESFDGGSNGGRMGGMGGRGGMGGKGGSGGRGGMSRPGMTKIENWIKVVLNHNE